MADPTKIFPKEDKCLSLDLMMNYIHNRLSNKERNHVERHMLQCEFCNEAMDGLSLSIEPNARDIIASVDEINHLESQILLSARLQEPEFSLDETSDFSKKELLPKEEGASFGMAMPAAAAPKPRKAKASSGESKKSILKVAAPAKKNFNWSRIAAAITGLMLLGGGIFFILQQKWTTDHPVAVVKNSEVKSNDSNIDIANTDSIIAIAPLQKESLQRDQPYSDGVIDSEIPANEKALEPNTVEEVQMEENGIVRNNQESEMMEEKTNGSPAPAKQDADKLSEVVIAMDKNIANESNSDDAKKEIALKASKARKVESKRKAAVPATADVAMMDSDYTPNGNSIQTTSFDIGLSLYNKSEYTKAIVQFLNVKKSEPNYEEARWYLAKSYTAIGEKERAKKVYLELVEINGKYKDKAENELK